MPTLIRLLGDSAKNNTEVRNAFKEPVFIPANARVALTGLNAVLADDIAYETFYIAGNAGEFRMGIVNDSSMGQPLATIPVGDYTAAAFVDEFEIAANYTGTDGNRNVLLGVHNIADLSEGKLRIQTYLGPLADAEFNEATLWTVNDGAGLDDPAAISATGFTATATAASATEIGNLGSIVPLVSSRFVATFVNADTVAMQLGAAPFDDPDKIYWGVRVIDVAGDQQYQYGYWDGASTVWEDIGDVLAEANDVVELNRFGSYAKVKITRAGGALAADVARTGITRAMSSQSKGRLCWFVRANTGGQMASCQCTKIDGIDPLLRLMNTTVDGYLKFVTGANAFNSSLAMYCGFPGERNEIVYRGNPATLVSRMDVGGSPAYPGVLVTLDGLGLLRSYDGAATAKSPANIIYSVNELQNKQQYLQLDVPQPLYLDVGNPAPINVNELRVRLFEAGGYNPLTFIGKPSFSFIIAYPKGT